MVLNDMEEWLLGYFSGCSGLFFVIFWGGGGRLLKKWGGV
jgi:hypothetical protein